MFILLEIIHISYEVITEGEQKETLLLDLIM